MLAELLWWSGLTVGALGTVLLVWAIFVRGRARGTLRCAKCWYDMSGAVAEGVQSVLSAGEATGEGRRTCPECGRIATRDKHLLKTRRHWRLALLGLFVMMAGVGTGAWPMLSAKHWQRYAPSTALVFLADAVEPTTTDETWKELAARAKYDQLARWQRGILAGKLGEGLATLPTATADEHVELICLLRPPSSEALALELVAYRGIIQRALDAREKRIEEWRAAPPSNSEVYPALEGYKLFFRHQPVIKALSYAGTDIGRDELVRLLRPEDLWSTNAHVVQGIARIGDEQAIAALCDHVAEHSFRFETLFAIASIGPRARTQAEPVLLEMVDSANADLRQYIGICLGVLRGEIGDITIAFTHERMLDAYTDLTTDRTANWLRREDVWSRFEPDSPGHPERVVPVLIEYLGSETINVRNTACMLLQAIGPNARPALPALKVLLNDPGVAKQAQSAIDAIRRPD